MFMKKGNLFLDAGIVGLALFATIFGAGNLVFPPILGLTAGTDWVPATLGPVSYTHLDPSGHFCTHGIPLYI